MFANLKVWLDIRLGHPPTANTATKPSFAYSLGPALAFLLLLEIVTGILLAFYYSPSTNNAWASVAYIEDVIPFGSLVRGIHHHAASGLVIGISCHIIQTAWYGAYRKPRELMWWFGMGLAVLVLGAAVTGFILRWDLAGYWASKVEVGIAASTPVFGNGIRRFIQAGNEYSNLTVTRFFALHALILPGALIALVVAHIKLAYRHGSTPRTASAGGPAMSRWPNQTLRDMIVVVLAFGAVVAWSVTHGGAGLEAPADPTSAYDARPLWYFRWLFELRRIFGSWETVAALGTPAVLAVLIGGLPMIDRDPKRSMTKRMGPIAVVVILYAVIGTLTYRSFAADAADNGLAKRRAVTAKRSELARRLAKENGVPSAGGAAVFTTAPFYRARTVWNDKCAGCHDAGKDGEKDSRKAPLLTAGIYSRTWIRDFFTHPDGDAFFGRTKKLAGDKGMPAVDKHGADLDGLVEMVYAETGAKDVDQTKVNAGIALFEDTCGDCHSRKEGEVNPSAPSFNGIGTRDHFMSVIEDAGGAMHFGAFNDMPAFNDRKNELSSDDRRALADYLIWLRTATPADITKLGEL